MGIITDVILPIALAFIMFSLGLGLTVADFTRVLRRPRFSRWRNFSNCVVTCRGIFARKCMAAVA